MESKKYNKQAEELANLIEANPNCKIEIDNDCWYVSTKDDEEIISSNELDWETEFYSSSSLYGAGISEALVILLDRKGISVEVSAV